jgi:NADH-quinone oxidoreductase subunit A
MFATLLVAIVLSTILIIISRLFGPHRPNRAKRLPYESGMEPVGSARDRQSIHFYLVAMSFIIFDVEAMLLFPWAILLQDELRLFGLAVMGIFMLILAVGLLWELKKGTLDWD